MYELRNINCKPERNVWVVKYKLQPEGNVCSGLQFIFHNSYITLRLAVYISQVIHYAQTCSLYFTTHTSLSGLQFIFHNSYITLRLGVYISQLIHHAQACSLYFTTHYITLRLTVYISQLIHYAQAYSLYFTTHTSRSGLQFIFHNSYITLRLQFIFHNSYITLRLAVYISQLIHHCKPERNVWVVKYKQ